MKNWILLFIGLNAFAAASQMNVSQYDTTIYHHEITLDAVADYGASAVQNGITNRFLFGGMIEDVDKENSLNRHNGVNRIGLDAGGLLMYRNYNKQLFKNKAWGYEIVAGADYFGGALYARDLFGVAMYGNEPYLGDTITLSGMDLSFTAMQKVGFGFFDLKTKSSVRCNLYNISNRFNGDFRDLEIQQSADGQEITVVMDGEIEMKQTAAFNQGIGLGFDLDFRIPISYNKEKEAFIQFKAENIGFGYMYEAQKRYSFDTTFTFDGFRFNQLIGDNSYFNDSLNILDTLGINSTDVKPVFLLPGFLQVSKMVNSNSDVALQSFFGLRVYPTLIYSPFAFAGVDYRISEHIHAGASVSYGGFSGLRFGAYTQMNWDAFGLGFGSDNFSGFLRKGGNGTALYVKAVCRF